MKGRRKWMAMVGAVALAGGTAFGVSRVAAQEAGDSSLDEVRAEIEELRVQIADRLPELAQDGYTESEIRERESLITQMWVLRVEEDGLGGGTD